MTSHRFTLNLRPKSKGRPRMRRNGKAYTPPATREYETAIADAYDGPQFTGPVRVIVDFGRDNVDVEIVEMYDEYWSPLTGDIDNYCKALLDGLNGRAWVDDRQVVALYAVKRHYPKAGKA